MLKALIFDLDGTLLNTLPDIRHAINDALASCGYDYRYSLKEAKTLIGDGADALVHRALRDKGDDPKAAAALKESYLPLYAAYQDLHTKPYNGMIETLSFLKARGLLLFVVSNKPDHLAQIVVGNHYGRKLFDGIYGLIEGAPAKPDPGLVNKIVAERHLNRADVLFVGDSLPDILTAGNAGIKVCLCLWGYGFYKPETLARADYVIKKPKELVPLVCGDEVMPICK